MTFNFINSYKEDIKNKDKIDYIDLKLKRFGHQKINLQFGQRLSV